MNNPTPTINRYQQCQYLISGHQLSQLPPENGTEIAFAGRSNSGKSSAINKICAQKSLARTSRTPGRTQAINFFSVSDHKFIVDLPGYGYAKVSAKIKQHWENTLTEYLHTRASLKGLMLIMDVRHPLQNHDWYLIELASNRALPIHLLLTKSDKLSKNQSHKQLYATKSELENKGIEASLQLFSALNGLGVDDAHSVLDSWFQFDETKNNS